jgi:hypothetical protein
MVVAKEFQLFQPIGGLGASVFGMAGFGTPACAAPGSFMAAALAMVVASKWRRGRLIIGWRLQWVQANCASAGARGAIVKINNQANDISSFKRFNRN